MNRRGYKTAILDADEEPEKTFYELVYEMSEFAPVNPEVPIHPLPTQSRGISVGP